MRKMNLVESNTINTSLLKNLESTTQQSNCSLAKKNTIKLQSRKPCNIGVVINFYFLFNTKHILLAHTKIVSGQDRTLTNSLGRASPNNVFLQHGQFETGQLQLIR